MAQSRILRRCNNLVSYLGCNGRAQRLYLTPGLDYNSPSCSLLLVAPLTPYRFDDDLRLAELDPVPASLGNDVGGSR
jgi:hypothetical protein